MGTKENPGKYDCYDKAVPDEPMFVLLARDPDASTLVRFWHVLKGQQGEDNSKLEEAWKCADQMDEWRDARNQALEKS
jgi:phosphatidylethanolamine-binding protein (PEBP) family uncharacterized protein